MCPMKKLEFNREKSAAFSENTIMIQRISYILLLKQLPFCCE